MRRYRCLSDCTNGPLTKGKIYVIKSNPKYTNEACGWCKHIIKYDDGKYNGINDYWFENEFKEVKKLSERIKIL